MEFKTPENAVKKRSANFSSREEVILVELTKRYKETIECKASDSRTHQQKSRCWEKIESEFNLESGETFRSKYVLKKKYANIKKRVKKKFADKVCHARGTGGGPPKDFNFTRMENEIIELLGNRVDGLGSEFDGDATMTINLEVETHNINSDNSSDINLQTGAYETSDHNMDHDYVGESSFNNNEDHNLVNLSSAETCVNWSTYTPDKLRTRKSEALQLKTDKGKRKYDENVSNKISQWATAKAAVEECKEKYIEEEHKLKLKHMQEKHEKELFLMDKKAELQLKLMKEEHELKMEVLRSQKNIKM